VITKVRIGTSGYSFDDWKGTFYPEKIAKGKMLDYYVTQFDTVEINSTYYRIPHPKVFDNMVKKTPESFDFIVKVPQSFTHRRKDMPSEIEPFRESVKPLTESEKLSGLLAQYPYSFKFSSQALDHICQCRDAVAPHDLFVEFRHEGWVNRTMYDRLRSEQIGYVCVDEPQLPGLLKPDSFATTDTAYVRLHGRNEEHWWNGGALRYDYSYSEEELEVWKEKLKKLLKKAKKAFVFFNNCRLGQAADNAIQFIQMINR